MLDILTNGISLGQASREYGVKDSVLPRWKQEYYEIYYIPVEIKHPKNGVFHEILSSHVYYPPTILALCLGLVADGRCEARLYLDPRWPLLQKLMRLLL